MFGYKLIFIKVWSNNRLLIPFNKVRSNNNKYYLPTNEYKHYKYRFLQKIIKEE